MSTVSNRARRWFNVWYQPNLKFGPEEWLYIGIMLLVSNLAFGLGLVIGFLWLLFL